MLLARRPRLARQSRWLTHLHGKDIWQQRLLSLLEWEPHLWSADSGEADEEFYDLPHKIYASASNSTN
jgi:hypothetical protein